MVRVENMRSWLVQEPLIIMVHEVISCGQKVASKRRQASIKSKLITHFEILLSFDQVKHGQWSHIFKLQVRKINKVVNRLEEVLFYPFIAY